MSYTAPYYVPQDRPYNRFPRSEMQTSVDQRYEFNTHSPSVSQIPQHVESSPPLKRIRNENDRSFSYPSYGYSHPSWQPPSQLQSTYESVQTRNQSQNEIQIQPSPYASQVSPSSNLQPPTYAQPYPSPTSLRGPISQDLPDLLDLIAKPAVHVPIPTQDLPDLLDLIKTRPVEPLPQFSPTIADLSTSCPEHLHRDEPPGSAAASTDEDLQADFWRSDADNFAMWYSTTIILESLGPVANGFQIGQNSDGIIHFRPPVKDEAVTLNVADDFANDTNNLSTKPLCPNSRLLTIEELSHLRKKEQLEVWDADAMIVDLHVALASESYLVPPPTLHLHRRKHIATTDGQPDPLHTKRRHSDMV